MTDYSTSEKFKDMMSLSERVLLEGKPLAVVYDSNGSYAYLGNSKINFSKNAQHILLEKKGCFYSKDYRIGKFYLSDKDKWIDLIVPSNIVRSFGVQRDNKENNLYYVGRCNGISKNLRNCLSYAFGWKTNAKLIQKFKRVKIVNIGFPPDILYSYLSIFFSFNDLSCENIDEIITINPDIETENIAKIYFPNVKSRFYKGYNDNVTFKEIYTPEEDGIVPLVIYFLNSNFSPKWEDEKDKAAIMLGKTLRSTRRLYEILYTFDIENLDNSPLELTHDEFELNAKSPKRLEKRHFGINKSTINRLVRNDDEIDLYSLDSDAVHDRIMHLSDQPRIWEFKLNNDTLLRQLHLLVYSVNRGIKVAEYHLFNLLYKNPYLIWNRDEMSELIISMANNGVHPIFNKLAGEHYYKSRDYRNAIEYLSKYILFNKSDEKAYDLLIDATNRYKQKLEEDLEECYKRERVWQKEMDDDWKSESFYALTDGAYGDYPDDFDDDYSFMGM